MTEVYFIRHAQSDRFTEDDRTRPLTEDGLLDAVKAAEALNDKGITRLISSPYKRTIQTISPLSRKLGIEIETDEDFRERNAGMWHGENFIEYIKQQWADFSYTIMNGECLRDVQKRNIAALNRILNKYNGQKIAIATHGTALSTIINYYDNSFGYEQFMRIIDFMPYIVKMTFDDNHTLSGFEEILIIEKEYK